MRNKEKSILDELLDEITPKEQARTTKQMLLAAKIHDGIIAKGLTQKQFAKIIGQNESTICRWLSGTHNFTSDTLFSIEDELDISLINTSEDDIFKAVEDNVTLLTKLYGSHSEKRERSTDIFTQATIFQTTKTLIH